MEGVDYPAVRAMLGGDAEMLRSLLGKLIVDFANVAIPTTGYEQVELIGYAARMHKLKGSAGILGLNVVKQLAETTERACEVGDQESIRSLVQQLNNEFRRLRDGAGPQNISLAAAA
jgi:Hpt domain